jgi:hypothetical protein
MMSTGGDDMGLLERLQGRGGRAFQPQLFERVCLRRSCKVSPIDCNTTCYQSACANVLILVRRRH